MFVQEMKAFIERKSAELAGTNPLLLKASAGELGKEEVVTYLHNLMHLFAATVVNLDHAKRRARELGFEELSEFMAEKRKEELGHDQWAKNDLHSLAAPALQVDPARITPGLRSLLAYVAGIIEEDPRLYLAYMVYVEYLTVLVAPDFLRNLESRCGVPASRMSSVANHGELDKDHVLDDFKMIENFRSDPALRSKFMGVLEDSAPRVDRFLAECVSSA